MKVASVENISDLSLRKFLVLILDFLFMMTRKGFYIFEIAHNLWRRLLATGLSMRFSKNFKKTDFHWFNPYPPVFGPEEEKEYMLIGMILGLAIYNNITLDVNFPPVLFKKILGYPGTFDDMEEAHPTIYRSMVTLLQYDGELPVEDCFCLTYQGKLIAFRYTSGCIINTSVKRLINVFKSRQKLFLDRSLCTIYCTMVTM